MSRLYSLRPELEFSSQTYQGKPYTVVKDPITTRYYRFSATQAAIMDLVREPIDIESLGTAISAQLGGSVKQATLEGFLDSLEEKHLLDTADVKEQIAEYLERKPKEDRNILYLRIFSLDPEKVFDFLLPKISWCFTPGFHVFAILAIITGFSLTYLHGDELTGHVLKLLNLYGFLLIWLVVASVVMMHEFAHGLTCRHFGGKVHELGFMLLYFQPAFYCDVSDSWMFPTRRERMWVTFAGGYFQLVLWGVGTVIWRVTAPDTLINQVSLIVILFAGLQTVFNFNPLIKLDGYYMLSDYLEIPNLRAKSFKALRAWIAGNKDEPLLAASQKRPLLTFGTISLTFSTMLLSLIYANIYILLTYYFAFAGLVGFLVFARFTMNKTASEPVAGIKSMITRATLRKYRNLGIGVTLLLISILFHWELKITADLRVLPRQESVVRSETAGTIAEVLVREGSQVKKGDVIVRLYDFDKERALSVVTGELDQQRAALSLLKAGPRAEEVDSAEKLVSTKRVELSNVRRNIQYRNQLRQTLARRRTELQLSEIEFKRTKDLFEEGLGPRVDMEKAETTVEIYRTAVGETEASIRMLAEQNDRNQDLKEQELAEAESALTLLLAGFRIEDIQQREASVNMLEEQRGILERELAKTDIRAPIDGTVVTPFVQRILNQHLVAGNEICRIVDMETVRIEMMVPEKEMGDVKPAYPIFMKVRSYPTDEFEGRVDFIAPVAETVLNERFIKVRTEVSNEDGMLKPEMTGVAKIHAGQRRIISLMTRRIIRWVRIEYWDLLP